MTPITLTPELIIAFATLIAAIGGMIASIRGNAKVTAVHNQFNSRFDSLIDTAKEAGRREGVAEGVKQEQDRAADVSKAKP